MNRPNSLQAILAREAAAPAELKTEERSKPPAKSHPALKGPTPPEAEASTKFYRPSRDGRRFLGGHFDPAVVRQMKLLAVEEDTTTQALLEEALNLLFVKKGKGKIIGV
ncbi:ribbon-helix-helix domain-containing protein [Teichococcus oryzae]|uniref:Antitoxin-like ribbon-helix-helix domain-containing protein n=1 Tax=Teichococcus oryzae TaxID=1608942 RepID=A0A5B2TB50_9PROT|nr:ribbon-helix-helix domain-containing protein [Pseudoroseomonas oryzae]KAA2211419.1 hypothetical protein F0Q34_20175 [Pseudoroseomonas oryzae]